MKPKAAWSLFKETFQDFNEDGVLRLSAALSYYSIFSVGPLLIVAIALAGFFLGSEEAVRKEIEKQLQSFMGGNASKVLDSMAASRSKDTNVFMAIVGIVALLFGATGVFAQLQDSLNTIWEVKAKPGKGLWNFIRHRLLSLGMVLGIGFLLLVSMVLSTVLATFTSKLGSMLSATGVIAHIVDVVVSVGVTTLLFAAMFKFLPDVKISWRNVWVGALGTALLFALGKHLLGLYLGRESTESAYGAAGAVVIILLWFYYASIILFFGAEFTQVYARRTGSRIVPSEYAVPISDEQRAQEGLSGKKMEPGKQAPEAEYEPIGEAAMAAYERAQPVPVSPVPGLNRESVWTFVGVVVVTGLLAGASLRRRIAR